MPISMPPIVKVKNSTTRSESHPNEHPMYSCFRCTILKPLKLCKLLQRIQIALKEIVTFESLLLFRLEFRFGDVDVVVDRFYQGFERVVVLLRTNESGHCDSHLTTVEVFGKFVQNMSFYRFLRVIVVRIPT